jgi:hypothetical protein
MANIKSLSTDIIIEYIIPEFDFKTISDVHMSHMFENIDITDMIKTYISHNMIFNDQKYNIYDVLQNSSITVVDFDNIIKNLKKKEMIQKQMHFNMLNLNSSKIQNTITIFKMFKKYCTQTDINNRILRHLMKYISNALVQQCNKKNIVCPKLQKKFTRSLELDLWENIDIDIYEFFKKCNLLMNFSRSHELKYNIDNQICINQYNNDKTILYTTMKFFLSFFQECKRHDNTIHINVYIIYELYKYLNYIEDNNVWNSPIDIYKKHSIATKTAAMRLKNESDIHYRYRLPVYLYNKFVQELDTYILR